MRIMHDSLELYKRRTHCACCTSHTTTVISYLGDALIPCPGMKACTCRWRCTRVRTNSGTSRVQAESCTSSVVYKQCCTRVGGAHHEHFGFEYVYRYRFKCNVSLFLISDSPRRIDHRSLRRVGEQRTVQRTVHPPDNSWWRF